MLRIRGFNRALMDKRLRPIPFPWGTQAYRTEYRRLRAAGYGDYFAMFEIRSANRRAQWYPAEDEKCLARTRTGAPCQRKAGMNGRCPNHGGSTPRQPQKTPESRARSLANLKQYRNNPLIPKIKVE